MNLIKSEVKTMSSREIAELTNKRHDNVLQLVRKLQSDQILTPEFQETPFNGRSLPVALLDKRDSMVLVARLSPEFTAAVVDRWQELEEQAAKPMSQLEVLAGMANSLLEQERRQLEQEQAVARIEQDIEKVKETIDGTQVWEECPPNAESITAIRARINGKYSVPAWAINEIVQGDYGPRPAGSVRNKHENANGGTYVVYWKSSISKLFDRVYEEAEEVTATLCTHPYVSKRFKMV